MDGNRCNEEWRDDGEGVGGREEGRVGRGEGGGNRHGVQELGEGEGPRAFFLLGMKKRSRDWITQFKIEIWG